MKHYCVNLSRVSTGMASGSGFGDCASIAKNIVNMTNPTIAPVINILNSLYDLPLVKHFGCQTRPSAQNVDR